MKSYKITVVLDGVVGDDRDEDSFRESVKEALQVAIELDDSGDEDLVFTAEEEDEDWF